MIAVTLFARAYKFYFKGRGLPLSLPIHREGVWILAFIFIIFIYQMLMPNFFFMYIIKMFQPYLGSAKILEESNRWFGLEPFCHFMRQLNAITHTNNIGILGGTAQ